MASVKLVGWRGCGGGNGGGDGPIGIAAVQLVEVALEIREITVVRREDRLSIVMPHGSADGSAAATVLRWGSAAIGRRVCDRGYRGNRKPLSWGDREGIGAVNGRWFRRFLSVIPMY